MNDTIVNLAIVRLKRVEFEETHREQAHDISIKPYRHRLTGKTVSSQGNIGLLAFSGKKDKFL